jgi:hypothetical protein
MKTITLSVTDEDIEFGNPGESESCPIARAFERATGVPCSVSEDTIEFRDSCCDPILLPEVAKNFVFEYDLGFRDVEPTSFEIEVPDYV